MGNFFLQKKNQKTNKLVFVVVFSFYVSFRF